MAASARNISFDYPWVDLTATIPNSRDVCSPDCGIAAWVPYRKVLLVGGIETPDQVYECDLRDGSDFSVEWKSLPQKLKISRMGCSASVVRHGLYIFGGYGVNEGALDSIEVIDLLNPANNHVWETKLPQPRYRMAVAVVKDTIYLVGGEDENGKPTSSCWAVDVVKETVLEMPAMKGIRTLPSIAAGHNANGPFLAVLGGYKARWVADAEILELSSCGRGWQTLPPLPLQPKQRVLTAFSLLGNTTVICAVVASGVLLLDTTSLTWSSHYTRGEVGVDAYCDQDAVAVFDRYLIRLRYHGAKLEVIMFSGTQPDQYRQSSDNVDDSVICFGTEWSRLTQLDARRKRLSWTAVGEELVAAGGYRKKHETLSLVNSFALESPHTQWVDQPPLLQPRENAIVYKCNDDRLYVFFGYNRDKSNPDARVLLANGEVLENGRNFRPLRQSCDFSDILEISHAWKPIQHGETLYFTGFNEVLFAFDLRTESFTQLPDCPIGRKNAIVVLWNDSIVLLGGAEINQAISTFHIPSKRWINFLPDLPILDDEKLVFAFPMGPSHLIVLLSNAYLTWSITERMWCRFEAPDFNFSIRDEVALLPEQKMLVRKSHENVFDCLSFKKQDDSGSDVANIPSRKRRRHV